MTEGSLAFFYIPHSPSSPVFTEKKSLTALPFRAASIPVAAI